MKNKKLPLITFRDKDNKLSDLIDKTINESNGKYSSRSHFIKSAIKNQIAKEKTK